MVNQLREFAVMLCVSAVACCALKMLLPESSLEPVLKTILAVFFLLCLLAPIRDGMLPELGGLAEQPELKAGTDSLADAYEKQLGVSVEKNLKQIIETRLQKKGIDSAEIQISVNTNGGERIDINEVEVTLQEADASRAAQVEEIIQEEMELPCRILLPGEVQTDGD